MQNNAANKNHGVNIKDAGRVFQLEAGETLHREMAPGIIQFGKYIAIALSGIMLFLVAILYLGQNERLGIILISVLLFLMGTVRFYTTRNAVYYVTDKRIIKAVAGGIWDEVLIKEIREISFRKTPWGHRVFLFVVSKGKLFRVALNDLKPVDAMWLKNWIKKHKYRPKEIRG
ncbi:MAG: hypothetical protein ACOX3A_05660 [bacterium]|jgi:hypothetical protein